MTENRKLLDLIEQHETNTGSKVEKVVGDHKYGTLITPEGSFPRALLFTIRPATLFAVRRVRF